MLGCATSLADQYISPCPYPARILVHYRPLIAYRPAVSFLARGIFARLATLSAEQVVPCGGLRTMKAPPRLSSTNNQGPSFNVWQNLPVRLDLSAESTSLGEGDDLQWLIGLCLSFVPCGPQTYKRADGRESRSFSILERLWAGMSRRTPE